MYSDRLGYFGILIYLLDAIIETIILFTNEDYKADKVMNNNVVTIKNSSLFNNPLAQKLYSRYLYNNIKNDDGTQYFTGNEYDIMAEWQWHNIVTWGTISFAIDGLLSADPIKLVGGVVVSVVAVKHTFTAEIGHSIEDENNRPIVYIPSKVIKWVLELLNKNK